MEYRTEEEIEELLENTVPFSIWLVHSPCIGNLPFGTCVRMVTSIDKRRTKGPGWATIDSFSYGAAQLSRDEWRELLRLKSTRLLITDPYNCRGRWMTDEDIAELESRAISKYILGLIGGTLASKSREWLPQLVAEVERLQAENAEFRSREKMRQQWAKDIINPYTSGSYE